MNKSLHLVSCIELMPEHSAAHVFACIPVDELQTNIVKAFKVA